MTIHKVEYLLLFSVLKDGESLKNVASDWQLSHAEVAAASDRLFRNGDILAILTNEEGVSITDVVLTLSEIKAALDGKLSTGYYLSPQGGARWESLCRPDWNRFYQQRSSSKREQSQIICADPKLIEKILEFSCFHDKIPIPETEVWDVLEPWSATYWKTLPKAYRCRYQYLNNPKDFNTYSKSEAYKEARKFYYSGNSWYVEPELDENPSSLFGETTPDYYVTPAEVSHPKVEYSILEMAVIFNDYRLRSLAYSKNFSHAETALAAHSLFERGDIRARVFAEDDFEGTPNVTLTMSGIKDHLEGRLRATYYLTPQGGDRWEAMSHPDWNKFCIPNVLSMFPYEEGILGTRREIIEKLLSIDRFVLWRQHVPGTEVWKVMEPWAATYWKTLPRGYHVSYQTQDNSEFLDELEAESAPTELVKSYQEACQWYDNLKKWYSVPEFD